jgi:uncharacterized lipoprotein YajG
MKIKSLLWTFPLASMAFLSGCVTHTTEAVRVQPEINVERQNIGNQSEVAVRVIDDRNRTDVGGRNSWSGSTVNIRVADNLTQSIGQQVMANLAAREFHPVPYTDNLRRKLIVRILKLSYNQSRGIVTTGTTIDCVMQISAENNGRTYTKTYRGGNNLTNVLIPNASADSKAISAAISDSLNHLLDDRKLLDFLAQ